MLGLAILLAFALALLLAIFTVVLAWEMVHPLRHTAGYAVARGYACDPEERGLSFEEWNLDLPDGAMLPVWSVRGGRSTAADQQEAANRAVARERTVESNRLIAIFVHGWGHSRIDALTRIDPFLHRFDLLAFYDLRGHGEAVNCLSRLGDGEDRDLLRLIESLGEGRFVLIGHSMGAVIAIAAAARAQPPLRSRIAGILAYGPYCEFRRSLEGRLRVANLPTWPLTDLALLVHRARGVKPLSLSERDVVQLACPLLILHGTDDAVSPVAHARRIAAASLGARLAEIEAAGHTDTHALEVEAHDQLIAEFMQSIDPPAANPAPSAP